MKTYPGEIAHADVTTSLFPGVISQIVGFLTFRKFHHASFFVDDRSDNNFACHQKSTNANETKTDKWACESDLRKHGKEVRHCHV